MYNRARSNLFVTNKKTFTFFFSQFMISLKPVEKSDLPVAYYYLVWNVLVLLIGDFQQWEARALLLGREVLQTMGYRPQLSLPTMD